MPDVFIPNVYPWYRARRRMTLTYNEPIRQWPAAPCTGRKRPTWLHCEAQKPAEGFSPLLGPSASASRALWLGPWGPILGVQARPAHISLLLHARFCGAYIPSAVAGSRHDSIASRQYYVELCNMRCGRCGVRRSSAEAESNDPSWASHVWFGACPLRPMTRPYAITEQGLPAGS